MQREISRVVHQEASVSERDLNELDKRINNIVSSSRKSAKAASQPSQADAKSIASRAQRSVARSNTETGSLMAVDCDQQIISANHGKVIGMTSAEWNNQVQRNHNQWIAANREKQHLLMAQREQMRSELQLQMAIKSEKERALKQIERVKHQEQLAAIERKLVQDEIEAQQHEDKIRRNISMPVQYNHVNRLKADEQRRIRNEETAKRQMLDEGIRAANLADARMENEKRNQLRSMAQDDRKAKLF